MPISYCFFEFAKVFSGFSVRDIAFVLCFSRLIENQIVSV
jgi:hypothetical protein